MKQLKSILLSRLAVVALLQASLCLNTAAQNMPPAEIQHLYGTEKNMKISDDFNSPIEWDTKWTYRTKMGGMDQIVIKQDETNPQNKYISIKAVGNTKKGAGLCTMNYSKYGFYIIKWRTEGITDGVKNNWHPSTWASCINFGVNKRDDGRPYQRMELDPMEGFGKPDWGSHFITWTGSNSRLYGLKGHSEHFPKNDEWSIIGMEYTPNYIAGWEYNNGKWNLIKTVKFTDERNSSTKVNYHHREHVYWIHSNIFVNMNAPATDSEYHLDYFYHYPYKYDESMQTNGVNYAMIEGTTDEVKVIGKMNEYQGKVVIPATIQRDGKTYKVTAIDEEAFRDCESLTEVVLPEGLKSIGYMAFDNCGLVKNSPEGPVYINNYLVGYHGVKPIKETAFTVKEGTTIMADGFFNNWRSLTNAILPESMKVIPNGAFEGCVALKNVTFSQQVTAIGNLAFTDCGVLREIPKLEALTTIGKRTFERCKSLESITLSKTINTIESQAFVGCEALAKITMTANEAPTMTTDFSIAGFPVNTKLYVPANTLDSYTNSPYWKNFAMILDPTKVGESIKAYGIESLTSIHNGVELFEDTKYVGHQKVDDTDKYNECIKSVEALKSETVEKMEIAVNEIINQYKTYLDNNVYMPQEGKYYVLESTGFYDSQNIKVYEKLDYASGKFHHPAWKAATTFDAEMLWQVEYTADGFMNFKNPNSKKYIADFKWGTTAKTEADRKLATKFKIYNAGKANEFQIKGTLVKLKPGATVFLTITKDSQKFNDNRKATEGNYISAFTGNITDRPNGWKIREIDAIPIAIDDAQYVTRNYPFSIDLTNVDDAQVFLVESQDANTATLVEFTENILPANTAFVLYSETPHTVNLPISDLAGNAVKGNILKGTLTEYITSNLHKSNVLYIMGADATGKEAGFYKLNPATYKNRIHTNRGYLITPKTATAADVLSIKLGETTGIDNVKENSEAANVWYTLSGVKVNRPTKGIFVNGNGKIVLFK